MARAEALIPNEIQGRVNQKTLMVLQLSVKVHAES